MILIALVLLGIALAGGMELQEFVDVFDSSDALGVFVVIAALVAVLGDLRRLG